jgi:hypothetical protein
LWQRICIARNPSQTTKPSLSFVINGRWINNSNPSSSSSSSSSPERFFGNATFFTRLEVSSPQELREKSWKIWAREVREAIQRIDEDYVNTALAYIGQCPNKTHIRIPFQRAFLNPAEFAISNWGKFSFYNVSFSLNRDVTEEIYPIFMGTPRVAFAFDGMGVLMEAPPHLDGIVFVLGLRSDSMQNLMQDPLWTKLCIAI